MSNEIPRLYFQVVKKYALPTWNHTVLKQKIKALESEVGFEPARIYLQALLDFDWYKLDGDFKPIIANSLDIYGKRVKILHFLQANVVRPTVKRLPGKARGFHE